MDKKYDSQRRQETRFVRDRYFLSVEGNVTEVEYFNMLEILLQQNWNKNRKFSLIIIDPTKKHKSAPDQVLKRMKKRLKNTKLNKDDEAWLIVDRNSWSEHLLNDLENWAKADPRYFFALSNPNLEFWLLLHFNKGNAITSKNDSLKRLRNYLKNYDKHINPGKFNLKNIKMAIKNANVGKINTLCSKQCWFNFSALSGGPTDFKTYMIPCRPKSLQMAVQVEIATRIAVQYPSHRASIGHLKCESRLVSGRSGSRQFFHRKLTGFSLSAFFSLKVTWNLINDAKLQSIRVWPSKVSMRLRCYETGNRFNWLCCQRSDWRGTFKPASSGVWIGSAIESRTTVANSRIAT